MVGAGIPNGASTVSQNNMSSSQREQAIESVSMKNMGRVTGSLGELVLTSKHHAERNKEV